MRFRTYSHRHGLELAETVPELSATWNDLSSAIRSIKDAEIRAKFEAGKPRKSISTALNLVIKEKLCARGWRKESPIFQGADYNRKQWKLDFAKDTVSVEVAFNHGEAIAWNLLKPVLASEQNHVKKAIQTRLGIVICATAAMKQAGGFDNAVGEFEKFERYFLPFMQWLTAPMIIVGLESPRSFSIRHQKNGSKKIGFVHEMPANYGSTEED